MTAKRRRRIDPRAIVVFSAIALIPVIYSGVLTHANIDPTNRLDTVPAAVVNADDGATGPDGDPLDLGDELTDELTSSTETNNFDWARMSADDAQSALEYGDVYAVMTIPEDFSENAVSAGADDVADAATAKLSVETNDGLNMISGTIASTIGTQVTDVLRDKVSTEYLDNIYLGFTKIHDSISDAADGAGQLVDGADDAVTGSDELVVGLEKLSDGTARLSTGALTLAQGAHDAASGSQQLSSGLGELRDKTASLPDQAAQLDDGAQQIASGTAALSDRMDAVIDRIRPIADAAHSLRGLADEMAAKAQDAASSADSAADRANGLLENGKTVRDGAGGLKEAVSGLGGNASEISTEASDLLAEYDSLTDEERRAALTEIVNKTGTFSESATSAKEKAGSVASTAAKLIGGDGNGLTGLKDAADQAREHAKDLREHAGQTVAKMRGLVDELEDKIHAAVQQAVDAVHRLASGADQLADGTAQFAAQAGPLADGIATAASGASDLASGNASLASGADTLADGAGDAASGSAQAVDGATALNEGLRALADGAARLHDGLVDGAGDVPTYTDGEARALSEVAASPVTVDAERMNEVDGYGAGLAPYFLSLALWVGAMSFYMMASAMSRGALAARRPAWLVTLRSLVPGLLMGVAQAILAACVLHFWVGIDVTNLPGILGVAVLASVTFMAINQALIALLGAPGRFIALLLIVLQLASAGGTYPIETAPAVYQWLHNALPITHTVEAFRSLVAGGGIGIGPAVAALAIWLAVALVLSLAASLIALRKERKDDVEADMEQGARAAGREARPVAAHAAASGSAVTAGIATTTVLEAPRDADPATESPETEAAEATAEAPSADVIPGRGGEEEGDRDLDAPRGETTDAQAEVGDVPVDEESRGATDDDEVSETAEDGDGPGASGASV